MYGNKISEQIYPQGKSSSPLTTYYEYDLAGNLVKTTDAKGRTTKMSYDEVNNPVDIVMPDGNKISYDYTVWNSVKKTTQGDGDDKYSILETYDDRGLSVSHRQLGLDIRTKPWYYSYRSDGLLEKATAPDGTEHSYLYDNSGNNTLYTAGALSDEKVYNHFGQVDRITRSKSGVQSGSTDYIYDSAKGWLTSKVTSLGTTGYSYNATGNVVGVTSPNGLTRTYTRDAAERLTGLTADEKTFAYEYYGDGLIKSITYPGGDIVTSYTYDNANRLTKLETKNGNTVLKTYTYKYDGVGNIISVSGSESAVYTYDELNRLKTATENGYTSTYTYDNRNNLISETRDDGYVKTYEYSGDNRLVKSTENGIDTLYEYDLNGNLIKRGEDEFAYDSNDNLVYSMVNGVETTYEIGEDGLRKSKTTNGITTTYSIDENGNVITEGDDEIIIGNVPLAKKIDGEYYYYIYNAHGDVVMIVDESGNIKNAYRYDAWGTVVAETETISNSHKYAGEYFDAETGLIYLRARYYDPKDRRFIQEDPARDELNWYAYCGNNPIMFVDPFGLYSLEYGDDGKVYAKIDLSSGDTLYNISQSEVGDGNAWVRMGYEGDPGCLGDGQIIDITGIYGGAFPNPNPNAKLQGTLGLSRFIDAAVNQMPYKERKNNDTPYGKWYGMNNQPWCAMFVSWAANEADLLNSVVPKYASCAAGRDWYINKNRFYLTSSGYEPKAGDVFFHSSSQYPNGGAHTGIVIAYRGGYMYTIEGNASDSIKIIKHPLSYAYGFGSNGGVWDGEVPSQYSIGGGSTY